MDVWVKKFKPSKVKKKRFQLVLDDIPLPSLFDNKKRIMSVVNLESEAEAGNHFHTKTDEVFVGFGTIKAIFEDRHTKEQLIIDLNPLNNNGLLTAVSPGNKVAHKIINYGSESAMIVEISSENLNEKEIHDYLIIEQK